MYDIFPVSVHPRKRGEHLIANFATPSAIGPSPQTRGTQYRALEDPGKGRSIPANAGNTAAAGVVTGGFSVHPRKRGEHSSNYLRQKESTLHHTASV